LAPAWIDGTHSIYGVGPWRRYATAGHSNLPVTKLDATAALARNADDHGYNVAPVLNAITDLDADAHRHGVATIFASPGETATTNNVLKLSKDGQRQRRPRMEFPANGPRARFGTRRLTMTRICARIGSVDQGGTL